MTERERQFELMARKRKAELLLQAASDDLFLWKYFRLQKIRFDFGVLPELDPPLRVPLVH